jgi:hypothetical protein
MKPVATLSSAITLLILTVCARWSAMPVSKALGTSGPLPGLFRGFTVPFAWSRPFSGEPDR